MASGDTIYVFTAVDSVPTATDFATLDTVATDFPFPVLDYDTSTKERTIFSGVMPAQFTSTATGITIRYGWSCTGTATGDTVNWSAQFVAVDDAVADINGLTFDTAATATDDFVTPSADVISYLTTNVATGKLDDIVGGDAFRMLVYRDATATGDIYAGDASLVFVELREQ